VKKGTCAHCGKARWLHGHGLCKLCYRRPEVKGAHPALRGEPTTEEIDALVAERMAHLPVWWQRDEERRLREVVARDLPRAVLIGRGLRRASDERKGF
jgi:hypothetical protein